MKLQQSWAAYEADRSINWSLLREMAKSPRHYQHRLTTPRPDTPAMRLGRAVHTATLEPDLFPLQWTVWDGRRAGKEWQEFAAVNADKSILTVEEYESALAIRDAVHGHKSAGRLLRHGRPEVTLKWTDPETRQRCKGRLDWLCGDTLTDLKTSRDVEPRAFGRAFAQLWYHGQLAFYRRGLRACGHAQGPVYVIAVEAAAPFDVMVYEVGEDELAAGDDLVRTLLWQVKDCRKAYRNRPWPGRDSGIAPLQFPLWALPESEYSGTIEVLS